MLVAAGSLTLSLPFAPVASAAPTLGLKASIDGRPVAGSTERRPIRLNPTQPAQLDLEISNGGSSEVTVRTVRLEGKVIGLEFFAYDTAVGIRVSAGATESRTVTLDLVGLRSQATGLIPGAVKLLDPDRAVLAAESMFVDVRGSLKSVYGVFGLAIAGLTVLSFVLAAVGVARHSLSPNRWARGLRFLTPGIGLGLAIIFALSALRVFAPKPDRWAPIVAVCSVGMFVLGYLTPTPGEGEPEEEEIEEDVENLGFSLPAGEGPGAEPRSWGPP